MPTNQISAAVTPVNSTEIAGSSGAMDISLLGMFLQADFVVKAVIIMLLLASFWCWAIIFEKMMSFKTARLKAHKFEKDFWSAQELDSFYDRVKKKKLSHPMAQMFLAAMEEWYRSQSQLSNSKNKNSTSQQLGLRQRMFQIMQVARNRELDKLSKGIGVLATVGSSAPFIGLFGTVWGIMNSFQSIALAKNTSLAVVAPGIAEALFATAIGLFAAIPAVIAYNKFSTDLDKLDGQLDDFATEFNTLLSRQLDG